MDRIRFISFQHSFTCSILWFSPLFPCSLNNICVFNSVHPLAPKFYFSMFSLQWQPGTFCSPPPPRKIENQHHLASFANVLLLERLCRLFPGSILPSICTVFAPHRRLSGFAKQIVTWWASSSAASFKKTCLRTSAKIRFFTQLPNLPSSSLFRGKHLPPKFLHVLCPNYLLQHWGWRFVLETVQITTIT